MDTFGRLGLPTVALVALIAAGISYFGLPSFGPSLEVATAINAITNTTYLGVTSENVDHFYNIFYAQDTSGENRFARPVRLPPAPNSVLDASAPGAVCPQALGDAAFSFTSPTVNISENCLSLRISRPAKLPVDAKLPVMVYIHGGGNILGSGADQLYTPDGLVRQANANGMPIVFVSMNYRLGIFGYAMNKALRDSHSANVGLWDQRAALEWLRENVAAFGGDPASITVVGQSVGASAIGLHLTSFSGNKGVPFDRAVLMSGGSGTNFNMMGDLVATNTEKVAKALGCTGDFDSEDTVECLRNVPLSKLTDESIALARRLRPPFGELCFYPSYDGYYIQDRPSELLKRGEFVKGIPLIGSWIVNDGAWYPPPTVNDSDSVAASFSSLVPGVRPSSIQRILDAYQTSDFESMASEAGFPSAHYFRAAQISRDLWFTCPVIDFTWLYTSNSDASSDVWLYEFNATRFTPVYEAIGMPFWGVAHLSDIPYVLNNEALAGGADNGPAQLDLSRRVSASIVNFVATGRPYKSWSDAPRDWPPAYEGSSEKDLAQEYPQRMTVKVFGGPYSHEIVQLKKGGIKNPSDAQRAVEWERLFQRCGLLSSLSEEISV